MATYFIGDVHGCYDDLMALLARVQFDVYSDDLIFVGDLINRGGKSLEVLRFVRSLGERARIVLGNHDISFLAYAWGIYHGRHSEFPEMFQADDAPVLLDWLRQQPLLIHNKTANYVVTHAGVPPRWSLEQAKQQARKAEAVLRGEDAKTYLCYAYERHADKWDVNFSERDKFRYRINGLTRLRYCDADGELDFHDKCPIGEQRSGLQPWFQLRKAMQVDGDTRLIFGHWAALGYHEDKNAICIDSGCAWGGELAAIKLIEKEIVRTSVKSSQKK